MSQNDMRSTPATWWIIPHVNGQPGLQAFRATLRKRVTIPGVDGKPVVLGVAFVMARGGIPAFNPETALYATSDMVMNLVALHGIQVNGDVCSARRLTSVEHVWKSFQDFDHMLVHPYLAPGIGREMIVSSYRLLNAIRDAAEI
jgi:hypothetical protein